MIRLDLPKTQCDRLSIVAHVNLPENVWSEMQEASISIHPDDEKPAVFYGSRYVVNNKTHAVRGHIVGTDEPDEYHIQVRYVPQDIERPPRSLKSVNLLIDTLAQHTENLSLECTVRFRYNLENGWDSRIPLPVPFFIGGDSASTHIDGVRLSKREGEQLSITEDGCLRRSKISPPGGAKLVQRWDGHTMFCGLSR